MSSQRMEGPITEDRPNVVVFVMDTTRAAETVPAERELTPNLSTLAAAGTEYTKAFTTAPWTLPSHASMFTGTYPTKHGAHAESTVLDDDLPTLAELFADAGYVTAGISNNIWVTEEFGLTRGFDVFQENGERTDAWSASDSLTSRLTDSLRRHAWGSVALARVRQLLLAEEMTGAAQAVEWIQEWLSTRDSDTPFFLFANCIEPHLEYRPPRRYAQQFLPDGWSYDRAMTLRQDPREYDVGLVEYTDEEWDVLNALYTAEIATLDEQIGALRDVLEAADEWDDTVFVAVSDHGENIGDHGFLGHQYSLYDTVLHVPLVVHGSAFNEGDSRSDRLVQTADLAPTLLDVANIDAPDARRQFQTESFHPDRGGSSRSHVLAEYAQPRPPIDVLESKFDDVPAKLYEYQRSLRAIRTDRYKFVRGSDGSEWLYEQPTRHGEQTDIASTAPRVVTRLGATLDGWLDSFEHADSSGSVTVSDATEDRLADLGYL